MSDASQVRVGKTGAIHTAPLGTTLPTTPTQSLAAVSSAYETLGYVSEDGVTPNFEDSVNKIKAWQGGKIVRTILTEESINIGFTLIQTSRAVVLRFFPGSSITEPSPGVYSLEVVERIPDPRVWIVDVIDGTVNMRFVLPNAELTERGELPFNNDDPIGWPMMIEALPDNEASNERRCIILSDDPALAA